MGVTLVTYQLKHVRQTARQPTIANGGAHDDVACSWANVESKGRLMAPLSSTVCQIVKIDKFSVPRKTVKMATINLQISGHERKITEAIRKQSADSRKLP